MRILVIGKNSQLGKSIHKIINSTKLVNDFIFAGRKELDLSSKSSISHYFDYNNKFDIVINCAAYTAVDKAEEEQELANQINHLAVKQLAKIASEQQIKLIHISTDYVFDGESGSIYKELDTPNPVSIYGKTKLSGEVAVGMILPTNAIIIRTSWLYSEYGNNFVNTMLRLGKERSELSVVNDQIGSPTYAADLVEMILTIIDHESFRRMGQKTQIYHYSNAGKCSWYEFAKEIFSLKKIECRVSPITTDQYKTLARRPKRSLLDNKKIEKKFSIKLKHWKDSLSTCLNRV